MTPNRLELNYGRCGCKISDHLCLNYSSHTSIFVTNWASTFLKANSENVLFFFSLLPPTLRRAALINCCELNVQCVSHINHSLSSAKPRLTDPDSIFCNQLSYSVILMTQTKASLIFLCEKVAFETAHSCFPDVLRLVCRAALKAFYITVMVSTVDV